MDKKVVIIDYGLGNLYSIAQACNHVGFSPVITSNKEEIINADSVILPGVGAFKIAMNHLLELDLVPVIRDFAKSGKPLMGICLGMQLLFDESEEFGMNKGLGLIPGVIKRFPEKVNDKKIKIPHIGWNRLINAGCNWANTPLREISEMEFMYFVHSYYAEPLIQSDILTYTNYQEFKYCSSIQNENIFGFQFHPEKSGETGLSIYKYFLDRKS